MMIQYLIFVEQGDYGQNRSLHKTARKKTHGKRHEKINALNDSKSTKSVLNTL